MLTGPIKPEVILALSKMLTEKIVKEARDVVEDGHMYDIEATLYVSGTIDVGEATMTKQVNKLNPYVLMQLALSKLNGVTIEAFVAEAMEIQKKLKDEEEPADLVEFKARVAVAMDKLTDSVQQRRRGAVKFDGDITLGGERVTKHPE